MPKQLSATTRASLRTLARCGVIHVMVLFITLGYGSHGVTVVSATYQKLCYVEADSRKLSRSYCLQDPTEATMELHIATQKANARYNIYNSIAHSLVPVPGALILGALADRIGRKPNLVYGITSMVLLMFSCVVGFAVESLTMYFILGMTTLIYLGGGFMVFMGSMFAYMNDIVEDRRNLALAVTLAMIVSNVGFMIGSFISAGLLARGVSYPNALNVSTTLFACSALWASLFLKDVPPVHIKSDTASKATVAEFEDNIPSKKGFVVTMCKRVLKLANEVFETFVKRRPNQKRRLLLLALLAYSAISVQSMSLDTLVSLYTKLPPFNFTPADISFFRGITSACSIVGSLTGTFAFRYFKVPNMTILLIGCSSVVLKYAFIAAAQYRWMIYLSPVFGALTTICVGPMQYLITTLVEPEEAGKVISAKVIVMDACSLIAGLSKSQFYVVVVCFQGLFGVSIITLFHLSTFKSLSAFNPIYEGTVATFPRAIFCVNVSLALMGLSLFLYISVKVKKLPVFKKTDTDTTDTEMDPKY